MTDLPTPIPLIQLPELQLFVTDEIGGSSVARCGLDCDLHVVRPGSFQCNQQSTHCPKRGNE